jgi:hypothetical protein
VAGKARGSREWNEQREMGYLLLESSPCRPPRRPTMTAMRYARPLLYGWKGKRAIPSLFSMPMMPLSPLLIPYLCLPAKIFFETCKHAAAGSDPTTPCLSLTQLTVAKRQGLSHTAECRHMIMSIVNTAAPRLSSLMTNQQQRLSP